MSMKKGLLSALGLALLAMGIQQPVRAQSLSEGELSTASYEVAVPTLNEVAPDAMSLEQEVASEMESQDWMIETESAAVEALAAEPVETEAELAYPTAEETELAQRRRRRRTRNTAPSSPNFIGIGGDIGTTEDLSFAVISKFSFGRQLGIRPSVLVGEDFAVLAPVTYEFSQLNSDVQGFQVRPYAGAGASYIESDDEDEFGLLLTGGVDIPVSRRFTVNAQANYAGVFTDSENFGVTVGVGYNFGGLVR